MVSEPSGAELHSWALRPQALLCWIEAVDLSDCQLHGAQVPRGTASMQSDSPAAETPPSVRLPARSRGPAGSALGSPAQSEPLPGPGRGKGFWQPAAPGQPPEIQPASPPSHQPVGATFFGGPGPTGRGRGRGRGRGGRAGGRKGSRARQAAAATRGRAPAALPKAPLSKSDRQNVARLEQEIRRARGDKPGLKGRGSGASPVRATLKVHTLGGEGAGGGRGAMAGGAAAAKAGGQPKKTARFSGPQFMTDTGDDDGVPFAEMPDNALQVRAATVRALDVQVLTLSSGENRPASIA